jgi:hypothetical protein
VKGIQGSSAAIFDFCAEFYLIHKVVEIGFVRRSIRKIENCSLPRNVTRKKMNIRGVGIWTNNWCALATGTAPHPATAPVNRRQAFGSPHDAQRDSTRAGTSSWRPSLGAGDFTVRAHAGPIEPQAELDGVWTQASECDDSHEKRWPDAQNKITLGHPSLDQIITWSPWLARG